MKKKIKNHINKTNKLDISLKQNNNTNSSYQIMKLFTNIKKKLKSPILEKKKSSNIFGKFFKSNDKIKSKFTNLKFNSKNSINCNIKDKKKYKIKNQSKEKLKEIKFKNKLKIFNQSNIDKVIKKISQNNILKKNLSQNNYILINNMKNFKSKNKSKSKKSSDKKTSLNNNNFEKNENLLEYAEKNEVEMFLSKVRNIKDYTLFNEKGWSIIHYSIWNNNSNFLNILIYNNIDVNLRTKEGYTPFMISTIRGNIEICKILINAKCNLNLKDSFGNTALHYACANSKIKIVKLLLKIENLEINIKNNENYIPFDVLEKEYKTYWYKLMKNKRYGLSDFEILNILGEGSFGKVYLVKNKLNNKKYAMKVLSKSKILKDNLLEYILNEKHVLSLTNHPFIVKLYNSFQTETKLFLILEYCEGGDLNFIWDIEKRFSEERSRIYTSELVLAIEELHKNNIIYRDLKPENIVLNRKGHTLLTDFGLSKANIKELHNGTNSFCGSKLYLSPEMIKQNGHGKMIDWYGIGLILYQMVVGEIPFYDDQESVWFNNIKNGELEFPFYLSENLKNLLKGLLKKNPLERLGYKGVEEIKNHKWFAKISWEDVYNKKLKPPIPILYNEEESIIDKETLNLLNLELKSVKDWTFIKK